MRIPFFEEKNYELVPTEVTFAAIRKTYRVKGKSKPVPVTGRGGSHIF
jgi:hypothetical protein